MALNKAWKSFEKKKGDIRPMYLKDSEVILSGRNIVKHWKDKEWWYTGVFDHAIGIYFSFFFYSYSRN